MSKRLVDTQIWQKEWFLTLSLKQKMLVKFLFDNCDCAGVYEPNFALLSFYIGDKISASDFEELKQIEKLENGKYFVSDFIKFQYGVEISDLNPKFSVHKGILKSLKSNGIIECSKACQTLVQPLENSFEALSQPLSNPSIRVSQPLQDMDKDKDKDKDNISSKEGKEKGKEKEKEDPYSCRQKLKNACNKKTFLSNTDCLNSAELSAEYADFWQTLPECLSKVQKLDFNGYRPYLSWLIEAKDDYKHYRDVRNGVYDKRINSEGKNLFALKKDGKSEEEILEELRTKNG